MPTKGKIRAGTGITITGDAEVLGTGVTVALTSQTLDGLGDVIISSPADNEVLAYDNGSSTWINQTAAEASLSATGHTHTVTSETLFAQTATVTVANTTTETTLVGSGTGSATLAANYLIAGKTIRITARGYYSTKLVSAGTLTIKIKFGSTVLVTTAAASLASSVTNLGWAVDSLITCRTTGGSGTVMPQGILSLLDNSGIEAWSLTATSAVTIDTTATQAVSITAEFSIANASNTISCSNFVIEGLL